MPEIENDGVGLRAIDPTPVPYPKPHLLSHIRRPLKRAFLRMVDSQVLGLKPLRAHVVIVGFPRSGTTLLQAMIESCVEDVRRFGSETRAVIQARYALRNHTFLVTKCPYDIFSVQEIRDYYATQRAVVWFILMSRDPRSVLTSVHFSKSNEYYVTPDFWRKTFTAWKRLKSQSDVIPVTYEDLVRHPDEVGERIRRLIGWELSRPFSEYLQNLSKDFDGRAMNSVRPVDPGSLGNWQADHHHERLSSLLTCEMPELPEVLVQMGYERNRNWTTGIAPLVERKPAGLP